MIESSWMDGVILFKDEFDAREVLGAHPKVQEIALVDMADSRSHLLFDQRLALFKTLRYWQRYGSQLTVEKSRLAKLAPAPLPNADRKKYQTVSAHRIT